jgi:hypothetical protein
MLSTQAATKVCDRNQNVKFYLLGNEGDRDNLKLSNNWQPKRVYRLLKKYEYIQFTNEKPIMMGWKVEDENKVEDEG